MFVQHLTGWRNTLQASKSRSSAGTSWPRPIWRGSSASPEGYVFNASIWFVWHAIVHQTRKSFVSSVACRSSRRYAAPLHKLLSFINSFYHRPKGTVQVLNHSDGVAPQMFLDFCFTMQSLKRCRTAFSTYLRSLVRKWETEYSYPLSYNRIYSMDRCHSTNCTWPDLCPLSLTTAHPLKDCICAAVAVTQVGLYLWIIKL